MRRRRAPLSQAAIVYASNFTVQGWAFLFIQVNVILLFYLVTLFFHEDWFYILFGATYLSCNIFFLHLLSLDLVYPFILFNIFNDKKIYGLLINIIPFNFFSYYPHLLHGYFHFELFDSPAYKQSDTYSTEISFSCIDVMLYFTPPCEP